MGQHCTVRGAPLPRRLASALLAFAIAMIFIDFLRIP